MVVNPVIRNLLVLGLFLGTVYLIFWVPPYIDRYRHGKRKCPYNSKKSDPPAVTAQYREVSFPTEVTADTDTRATRASTRPLIPRIIVQTNERDTIPEGMAKNIAMFLEKNPEYAYAYFDDTRARNFIAEKYPPRVLAAYDRLVPGAYKADLFRYCYLFENGGVYVDTGMMAIGSLRDLLKPDDVFVSPEDNHQGGIYNAFMACVPKHPIVGKAIELSVENIEAQKYFYGYVHAGLRITGPLLLSVAFEKAMTELRDRRVAVEAGKDYGGGVRLLRFYSNNLDSCSSGEIFADSTGKGPDGKDDSRSRRSRSNFPEESLQPVLFTKYPTYHFEASRYNTNPHYSKLWKSRGIYRK